MEKEQPDQEVQNDIKGTLMHKIGCQCFMCLAAYGDLTELGDEDDFRPF